MPNKKGFFASLAGGGLALPDGVMVFDALADPGFSAGSYVSPLTNLGTGGDADAAADANRAVWSVQDGSNAALFDGVSDYAIIDNSASDLQSFYDTGVVEIFMLARIDTVDGTNNFVLSQATSTTHAGLSLLVATDGTLRFDLFSVGGRIVSTQQTFTDALVPGQWFLMEMIADGTNITFTLGDTLDSAALTTAQLNSGAVQYDMAIGSRRDGLANWTGMSLAFLHMSTDAQDAATRTRIRNYAAATGLLP